MSTPPIIPPDLSQATDELDERVSLVLDDLQALGYLPRLHEGLRTREHDEWLRAHRRSLDPRSA